MDCGLEFSAQFISYKEKVFCPRSTDFLSLIEPETSLMISSYEEGTSIRAWKRRPLLA